MRIPFLSDPSVYAEDHLGRVFSFGNAMTAAVEM